MAYYRSKYYGIEASVDAVNKSSADEQLKWLFNNNNADRALCLCYACREKYYKDYSVRFLKGYDDTQVMCIADQEPMVNNTRFV
tara:strand:+ start:240 stop:491 length:252 start_codon:yes stop_codon:yes gene_type:complete